MIVRLTITSLFLLLLVPPAILQAEQIEWPMRPEISPDGSRIAFTWEGELWIASSSGGKSRRLTHHPAWESRPRWSPDGRSIVFASAREGSSDLWMVSAEGGIPRRLTWWSGSDLPCDWFPDGKELILYSDRVDGWKRGSRLYRLKIANDRQSPRQPVRITSAAASAARISPDGKKLLVMREGTSWTRQGYVGSQSAQVWLHHLESGQWQQLTPEDIPHSSPIWIDDQRFLLVEDIDGRGQLVERDINNEQRRIWTRFQDDSVRFPSVSDDGQIVIFEQGFSIWRLNRTTGQLAPIELTVAEDMPRLGIEDLNYSSATAASLSPDGKMVAIGCQGDILVHRTEKGLPANRVVEDTPRDDDPMWLPDGQKLLFVSKRSGIEDFYTVESSEPGEPRLDRCLTTEVKRFPGPEGRRRAPLLDPTGNRIAFIRGDGDLAIQDLDGENFQILHTGWSPPGYSWSPDGQWIAFSTLDNDFNRDVWLVPIDGTRAPFNLTANPRPDQSPAWSPDGRKLCFVSQRDEQGGDLWWLWLRKEDHQTTTEDRILAEDPPPEPDPEPTDEPAADSDDPEETEKPEKKPKKNKTKEIDVRIDFDGIRNRFRRAFASDNSIRSPIWGLDSKKVFFISSHESSSALYSLAIPEGGSPKKVASGSAAVLEWNEKTKKMLRVVSGTPTTVTATGTSTSLSFARKFPVDMAQRRVEVFNEAWAMMRDRFYDPNLKGLDWPAQGDRYRPLAIQRRNPVEFGLIINRMIGELNSSHQNFSAASRWSRSVRATGVPGWRLVAPEGATRYQIFSLLPGTPAAAAELELAVGDQIISIDGQEILAGDNLSIPLAGTVGRRVAFVIRRSGEDRRVVIRPISNNVERRLLYQHWTRENRKQVIELSSGRLGYLHIQGMNQSSLDRFAVELYEAGHGKEGLLIDVRENGGGWTTDHLLASLTRKSHAYTVPRAGGAGYPNDRLITPSWTRPVAVLCNQNSFSNAEIFSHAIKNLQRGPLIGVTTAGGVISTGGATLLDGSSIRVPFRGWYTLPDGIDMELHGAVPDVMVRSGPADEEQGRDRQLQAACQRLLEDLPPRRREAF